MTALTADATPCAPTATQAPPRPPAPPGPVFIGDIQAQAGGLPLLLLLWRRWDDGR